MAFNSTSIRHFIKEHGEIHTLRKRTVGTYDDLTGTVPIVPVDYKAYGYSFITTPSELTNNSIVKNSRSVILTNFQSNGIILPLPKVNDQIVIGDYELDIIEVDVVKAKGVVIYYSIKVKG